MNAIPEPAWISAAALRRLLSVRVVNGKPKPLHECTLRRYRQRGMLPYRKVNNRVYLYPFSIVCQMFGISESELSARDVLEMRKRREVMDAAEVVAEMKRNGVDPRTIVAAIDRKAEVEAQRAALNEELRSLKDYLAAHTR